MLTIVAFTQVDPEVWIDQVGCHDLYIESKFTIQKYLGAVEQAGKSFTI